MASVLPVVGIPSGDRVALAAQTQLGSCSSGRREEGAPGSVCGALLCELHSAVIHSPALPLGLVQNIKQLRNPCLFVCWEGFFGFAFFVAVVVLIGS